MLTQSPSEPISNTAKPAASLAVFGGFFAIIGFAFLIPVFLLPAFHVIKARSWRAVPCTIVHSEVVSHSGNKGGTTYSIKISFKYNFDNVHYVGTRYDFSIGSSSGFDYREAIVRRLHRGVHATCYVDPTDPAEAVIDRGPPRDLWFGLIPLVFVAVGVAIVVFAVRNAHCTPISSFNGMAADPLNSTGHLKQAQSPLVQLLTLGLFVLFWNGIISIFIQDAYFSGSNAIDWFERIFLIPFILIGLASIALWFHQLLAVFNPRPYVDLPNRSPVLGQSCELQWRFTGNASRISRLTIQVVGRERAAHEKTGGRHGNSSYTQESTFARLPIVDTTRKMEIAAGRATFTIPADTMHSFASSNNKIVWSIVLHAEISGWPDVKAEFPFSVAPQALKPAFV